MQLKDRFSQENVELLHEMKHFTASSHMSSSVISAQDIEHICRFYSLDATTVARERNDFVPVYQSMSPLIDTSDLCQKSRAGLRCKKTDRISKSDLVISTTGDDAADSEVEGTEESVEQQQQSPDLWVDRTL